MTHRILIALCVGLCFTPPAAAEQTRPNVVWVFVEDMSANFACYGETTIQTPHVDAMARQGVKFERAIATAPICSIFRSSIITGMYQTATGAHHHRSGRGELKIHLPEPVRPAPALFKRAGYHTTNISFSDFVRSDEQLEKNTKTRTAKTDYNFEWDKAMYDTTHWAARKDGQPFFCQVQLRGGKMRGHGTGNNWPKRVAKVLGSRTEAADVKLPAYLPDDPVIREDWAQYLDTCRYTDWEVGKILQRLEAAGVLDNTYVFFFTDHGVSHVRHKQFLYDGGVHVPLVVIGPGIEPGSVRPDVIGHIDITATSLALAGIEKPEWMQGDDVLADDYAPKLYVFSARDRADETVDHIRSVRSERFKYIRNFLPERPYLQPNRYKDGKPIVQTMRRLHKEGKLNAAQAKIMAETRPAEELYDTVADPDELHNLAGDPAYAETLAHMRAALEKWMVETNDRGRTPEPDAMYLSDMKAASYRPDVAPTNARAQVLHRNIALMKKWAAEGK